MHRLLQLGRAPAAKLGGALGNTRPPARAGHQRISRCLTLTRLRTRRPEAEEDRQHVHDDTIR